MDFGEGGWETILMHSTINGNPKATRQFMDHGLICESCFPSSMMCDEDQADNIRCGLLSPGVRERGAQDAEGGSGERTR